MKFSNDASIMDIDEGCLDDPDSDDEVENHLSKVPTMFVRLLLSPIMILRKRRGGDWRYASPKLEKITLELLESWSGEKFATEGGKKFLETYPRHSCLQDMTYWSRIKAKAHLQSFPLFFSLPSFFFYSNETLSPLVTHIPVFKIRGGRVAEERGTLPSRLLTSSVAPNLAATILLVGKIVEDVPSPLLTLSTAHVSVATMSPMVGAGGDSPSFFSVVLVRGDSSSLLHEAFTSSSTDVYHQDKRNGVVIDNEERTEPKRVLKMRTLMQFLEGSRRIEWLFHKELRDRFQLCLLRSSILFMTRLTG
ncbi:DNA-directed RNA polymerase subunit beta [Abeliophyllum distichum]|uniref:DNA-directed RNA polymerase subunit beta n=1 Tax=Abeliophyllum distichum TaxID=126358 RepID=A0ABD1SZW2_9LAMI